MSMITCTECAKEISSQAKSCPSCGAKVPHARIWLRVLLGLMCIPVAMVLFGFFLEANNPEYYKAQHDAQRDYHAICDQRYTGSDFSNAMLDQCIWRYQNYKNTYNDTP